MSFYKNKSKSFKTKKEITSHLTNNVYNLSRSTPARTLRKMRRTSILATVLVVLLMGMSLTSGATCNVAIKLKSFSASKLVAGSTFVINGLVQNTGSTQLTGLFFQLQVPNFLEFLKASPANKGKQPPTLAGSFISFPDLRLAARKKLKIKVKVGVPACQKVGSVQIQALAYQKDKNDQLTCITVATPYTVKVVGQKKSAWGKHAFTGNGCIVPTPSPSSSFSLVADNTRCLEAVPVFSRRRILARQEEDKSQAEPGRKLVSYTANECFAACGTYLGVNPYYFNLDGSGNCFCCETCLKIYDPNWMVSPVRLRRERK